MASFDWAGLGIAGGLAGAGFGLSAASNSISYSQNKKSQARAFAYAKALQQQQYDLSMQGYREAPKNSRQGLEDAGYNPLLFGTSASAGANVAGGTPVGANATDAPDFSQGISNAFQLKETAATVENLEANSRKSQAEAIGQETNNKYIDDKSKAEIANIQADTNQKSAVIENMKARLKLDQYLGELGIGSNYASSIYNADSNRAASKYSADKNYEGTKYTADNSTIRGVTLGALGTIGALYGPAKFKALKAMGKIRKVGF